MSNYIIYFGNADLSNKATTNDIVRVIQRAGGNRSKAAAFAKLKYAIDRASVLLIEGFNEENVVADLKRLGGEVTRITGYYNKIRDELKQVALAASLTGDEPLAFTINKMIEMRLP